MYCKEHIYGHSTILACCDKEHLGKTFKDGKIEFTAKESFYKGKEVTEEEFVQLLEESESVNLFGEKAVKIVLAKGLANEKSVIKINGIPHLQIYRL
ncbi:MAG: DUF424 family protein [Candidatus Diapherotrites archaeon]|nr:DUF424 family protein [Candidatus Diapherotrites archaeon]